MNTHEFRHHDIIKPSQRLRPSHKRNVTNDFANAIIIFFVVIAVFTLIQGI